ncbi:MAG: tail sheath stabilizer and completion protein, partial [Minisyncoccia bacterium]
MFEYFYHEILRRTVIAFGSLFNEINIKHFNNSGDVASVIKVPLAYGPTQKFLARLEQSPDLNKPVQITLPRMSFEFTGLTYDPGRKSSTTQTFTAKSVVDGKETKKSYLPVPYNMQFELSIMSKLNDDALQIVEQILPYFQPAYTMTVELVDSINEKRDVPVVLENITMQDDYEGNFTTRRVLIYTLRFTVKTYLFGPISSATKDIIKKTTIGYITGDTTNTPTREIVYSAEPRAIKNYTGTIVTNITKDIGVEDIIIPVNDASSILVNTYLDI